MVINFSARGISRVAYKLTRTPTLIIIIKKNHILFVKDHISLWTYSWADYWAYFLKEAYRASKWD